MVGLRRFLAAAILAICVGAPLAESFDQWDRSDGNEAEANLVIVALCVGVAMCAAAAVVAAVRTAARSTPSADTASAATFATLPILPAPIPNSRPPTPLRI